MAFEELDAVIDRVPARNLRSGARSSSGIATLATVRTISDSDPISRHDPQSTVQ